MSELPERDKFLLEAASGWLLLGNAEEAAHELEQVTPDLAEHPAVLLRLWEVLAARASWEQAVELAERLIQKTSENSEGYVKRAYALHELKRTREAWDCLNAVSIQFPEEWIIPYNLACYACQLGREAEALTFLGRALALGDREQIRTMALEDSDLVPLRPALEKIAARRK